MRGWKWWDGVVDERMSGLEIQGRCRYVDVNEVGWCHWRMLYLPMEHYGDADCGAGNEVRTVARERLTRCVGVLMVVGVVLMAGSGVR